MKDSETNFDQICLKDNSLFHYGSMQMVTNKNIEKIWKDGLETI